MLLSILTFLQRSNWSTQNGHNSTSYEKLKCIPNKHEKNCSFDKEHTCNTWCIWNIWDMVAAGPMSLNHTADRGSMSNQYPHRTTQQPRKNCYPVFCSLRPMDNKNKGLCLGFAFYRKNYLPDGRVDETVATVEELGDSWKTGPRNGVSPFVMNSRCV